MPLKVTQAFYTILLVISVLSLGACQQEPAAEPKPEPQARTKPADTVLINGGIYTVDSDRSWAQAAAVLDGRIVAVGSNDDIQAHVGANTRTIDLEGNIKALNAGISHLNSLGITSFIDAWVGHEDYQSYLAIAQAGGLSARVRTSLTYESGFAKHYGDEFEYELS